ncbi:MAG: hypothetical protein RLZZ59_755 [Pseudomonadota bacterium]|jgi:osmotically-inducible protein OsmY
MKKIVVIFTIISSFILSGCMPTIFGAAASGTVSVAKDKTIKESLKDTRISAGIKKDFISRGFRSLYAKIDVEVIEGRVLYTGSVASDEDVVTAVDIAWAQDGVTEVLNELSVDDKSNYFDASQYSRDSWITARIKAKTILERDIKFINFTIVTVKSVVYIFGIGRTQEELEKVAGIAADVAGVERVVVHARVKDIF